MCVYKLLSTDKLQHWNPASDDGTSLSRTRRGNKDYHEVTITHTERKSNSKFLFEVSFSF